MILIDVRTAEEYNEKHALNAINLSLQDIENGITPDVPLSTEIGVYCRTGGRSSAAQQLLAAKGFYSIKNLGGLKDVL